MVHVNLSIYISSQNQIQPHSAVPTSQVQEYNIWKPTTIELLSSPQNPKLGSLNLAYE